MSDGYGASVLGKGGVLIESPYAKLGVQGYVVVRGPELGTSRTVEYYGVDLYGIGRQHGGGVGLCGIEDFDGGSLRAGMGNVPRHGQAGTVVDIQEDLSGGVRRKFDAVGRLVTAQGDYAVASPRDIPDHEVIRARRSGKQGAAGAPGGVRVPIQSGPIPGPGVRAEP